MGSGAQTDIRLSIKSNRDTSSLTQGKSQKLGHRIKKCGDGTIITLTFWNRV